MKQLRPGRRKRKMFIVAELQDYVVMAPVDDARKRGSAEFPHVLAKAVFDEINALHVQCCDSTRTLRGDFENNINMSMFAF